MRGNFAVKVEELIDPYLGQSWGSLVHGADLSKQTRSRWVIPLLGFRQICRRGWHSFLT